jgi:hypothetical protein
VRGDLVTGLITSCDLQGEYLMQYRRVSKYTRLDELDVAHIMTGWAGVPKVDWQSLSSLGRNGRVQLAAELEPTLIEDGFVQAGEIIYSPFLV